MTANAQTFEVQRDDLHRTRVVEEPCPEPQPGQALLRVDRFAYTANNITYALAGDLMGYWQFFPAEAGWGRIPVWGFADVEASRDDRLTEGTRLYGYLPMSTHLLITPGQVNEGAVTDGAAHRQALPPTYNRYALTATDPVHDPSREAEQMLLFPLFFTGFLIDDQFEDHDGWGADQVIYSSASSKTAISAAFCTHRRPGVTTVGLTSAANHEFVASLGIYDEVVTYDQLTAIPDVPSVFVDLAGDAEVRAAVHGHLGDRLNYSCSVGVTHGAAGLTATPDALPGPEPVFFFAPDRIQKRNADWGRGELDQRVGVAWKELLAWVPSWFSIEERAGAAEVTEAHLRTLDGQVDPRTGLILSL